MAASGLSQLNYCRAAMLLGSVDGNLTALLSAHQSIGVPQPVKLFGRRRRRKNICRASRAGEISAFRVDGDERRLRSGEDDTRAEPTPTDKFRDQRRKALVHEWREGRRDCRDGADAGRNRGRQGEEPHHGVHRRR
jgi:hypothetical protein